MTAQIEPQPPGAQVSGFRRPAAAASGERLVRGAGQVAELLGGVPLKLEALGAVHDEPGVIVPGIGGRQRRHRRGDLAGRGAVVDVTGDDTRTRIGAVTRTRAGSSKSVPAAATCLSVTSAASTTRRRGAAGSAASSRSDSRAACISATYSSSSMSPLEYHSRSAGVTA